MTRTVVSDVEAGHVGESVSASVHRVLAERFLDTQELVVFGDAVGTGQGAGLDLRRRGRHRQVGDGAVLGFSGTMGNHCTVVGSRRHANGIERLGQRADLVELDEDRVGDGSLDALRENARVGDEEVVTHELAAAAGEAGGMAQPSQSSSAMPSSMVMIGYCFAQPSRYSANSWLLKERFSEAKW